MGLLFYMRKISVGLTGNTLKIIAALCMLIDHIGAGIIFRLINDNRFGDGAFGMSAIYSVCRAIGRVAFPIYIFLVIEGFNHTRSKWRYLGRMVLLSIVSEIPYDIALKLDSEQIKRGVFIEFGRQNVYFTLALGLLTVIIVDFFREKDFKKFNTAIKVAISTIVVACSMYIAVLIHASYLYIGVFAIVVAYFFSETKLWAERRLLRNIVVMLSICIVLCFYDASEVYSLAAILPACLYNGERGIKAKWGFYWFYPIHLSIIGLICLGYGV